MSEDMEQAPRSRRIFDLQINVQSLFFTLVGGICSLVVATAVGTAMYIRMDGKIDANNQQSIARDAALTEQVARMGQDRAQDRTETKEQVRTVQDQVTGVAGDVKEILRYLRDSSASKRPELGRWAK